MGPSRSLPIRIRPFRINDFDVLVLLRRLSQEASLPRDFLERTSHTLLEDYAQLKSAKEQSNSTVWVAETTPAWGSADGVRIAGFIVVSPKPKSTFPESNALPYRASEAVVNSNPTTFYLVVHFLYVHPDYFRCGVGSALLDHLSRRESIQDVFEADLHSPVIASPRLPSQSILNISLFTHQVNKNARAFYEAKGFKLIGLGVSPPPENEPDCFYSKVVKMVDLTEEPSAPSFGVSVPLKDSSVGVRDGDAVLEDLIFMGTGTSSQVPNTHCLTHTPILCRVCFEATCFEVRDTSTGALLARGTSTPGHRPSAAETMLSGNEYYAAVMGKRNVEPLQSGPAVVPPTDLSAGDAVPGPAGAHQHLSTGAAHAVTSSSPAPARNHDGLPPRPLVVWNHNRRRNTGCVIRYRPSKGAPKRNLVIDCGKSFYEASLEWFNRYRIRTIDALLLTHGHADAMFGLDDLRQFTIGPKGYRTQDHVDVYCNTETMNVVATAFPYLVDKSKATGGGDVSSLKFHVFDAEQQHHYSPVLIDGQVEVEPFEVEHGRISEMVPYMSLGFRIGRSRELVYVSDVNKFPEEAIERCKGCGVLVLDALKGRLLLRVVWRRWPHDEINEMLAGHQALRDAGIMVRAAYDGERIEL
ncbi:hypothetical protein HDU93_003761 [Gonapodya sp. JEL0774]|nr:hypothetical protein HDU93_003761 [Gonapodya sp. JEL0774]